MPLGYAYDLVSAQSDGGAITNTTSPASLLPTQGLFTLPANYIQFIGQELIIEASGRISTVVTTPGTMTFTLTIGGANAGVTPAFALNTVAKTNVTWFLRWVFTARAVGGAGNFMHTGYWMSEAVIGSPLPTVGGSGILLIPASAPAVGANIALNAAAQVNLAGKWSVADPANSIQLHQFRMFSPN